MTLRVATPSDAATIASLHAASWRSAYKGILREDFLQNAAEENRIKLWQSRFSSPEAQPWTLLALDEDRLIGFACVLPDPDPHWGSRLDNLHIRQDCKGQGIGRLLISRAATWVNEHRAGTPLHLFVYEKNHPAVGFYKKLGGQIVERQIIEAPDGSQVARLRCAWLDVPLLIRTAEAAGFPALHSDIGAGPA